MFDKLLFTKSILHTGKKRTGWSIPGAHFLRSPHATAARIVTSNGHLVDTVPYRADTDEGLQYEGRFSGGRIFEPLVLYHYVERGVLFTKLCIVLYEPDRDSYFVRTQIFRYMMTGPGGRLRRCPFEADSAN